MFPELWEAMLAAMKLGVIIIPTTTLLIGDDVANRVPRRSEYVLSAAEHGEI